MNNGLKHYSLLVAIAPMLAIMSGCASEMVAQCAMKSVSSDPLYGVGCGAAMAVNAATVVTGGAIAMKERLQQLHESNSRDSGVVQDSPNTCSPDTSCRPQN